MCRWLAYSGSPVLLEELLYGPKHSLIVQSLHSQLGAGTLEPAAINRVHVVDLLGCVVRHSQPLVQGRTAVPITCGSTTVISGPGLKAKRRQRSI